MKNILLFFLILALSYNAFSQRTITGSVTDEDGFMLPGVEIIAGKDTTFTKIDGTYELTVADDTKKLEFRYLGYETKIIKITKNMMPPVILIMDSKHKISEIVVCTTRETKSRSAHRREKKADKLSCKISGIYCDFEDEVSIEDSGTETDVSSGQLTAGELNDFGKWEMWQDISENELKEYKELWQIYPINRYCVLVSNNQNRPIINATVNLSADGNIVWQTKTDNTGKAELWLDMFDEAENKNISIQVEYEGEKYQIKRPKKFHKGINRLKIDVGCSIPNMIDIAFVIDATSSMSDELNYLQAEILDVANRIDTTYKDLTVNLSSVFYRDKTDDYLVKYSDFTDSKKAAVDYIKAQHALGGGDSPEAVDTALDVAVNKLNWSNNARVSVIFLVLDAPPHDNIDVKNKLQQTIIDASKKNIRIVPIVCSGINKSTEYLMRSIALATNGTYVFLTDDSGIGNPHIKPTTDKWDVELLNNLLVRLLKQYIMTPNCENKIDIDEDTLILDTVLVNYTDTASSVTDTAPNNGQATNIDTLPKLPTLKIYPNPTQGRLIVETSDNLKELFLCDFSGKILERYIVNQQQKLNIDLSSYPQGLYFIRYFVDNKPHSGKIILMY